MNTTCITLIVDSVPAEVKTKTHVIHGIAQKTPPIGGVFLMRINSQIDQNQCLLFFSDGTLIFQLKIELWQN